MADFLDVNVWVALTAESHPHHLRAVAYWRSAADQELAFCRSTAMGFVRVISNPHTTTGRKLQPEEAWEAYLEWRARAEVRFVADPDGVDSLISEWCRRGMISSSGWTDAYLAAFAVAGRMRLVTFDGGFSKFPGLELLLLSD